MEILKEWLGLIALVVALGSSAFAWLTRGSRDNAKALKEFRELVAEEMKAIDARVTRHGERISALEQEIKHLPDAQQFGKLEVALAEMSGNIKAMSVTTSSTSLSVERLETWAFAQGRNS